LTRTEKKRWQTGPRWENLGSIKGTNKSNEMSSKEFIVLNVEKVKNGALHHSDH